MTEQDRARPLGAFCARPQILEEGAVHTREISSGGGFKARHSQAREEVHPLLETKASWVLALLSHPRSRLNPQRDFWVLLLLFPEAQRGQVTSSRSHGFLEVDPKGDSSPLTSTPPATAKRWREWSMERKHSLGTLSEGRGAGREMLVVSAPAFPLGTLPDVHAYSQLSTPWPWGLPTQRPGNIWAQR